jgi:hypothetical protein
LPHISCLDMFRYVCHVHLNFMLPTFWYWWHQCIHITLKALESFLLHQELNHCTLANKRHWQPHFLHHSAETLIKRHMHHCALMCVTEPWLWLCMTWRCWCWMWAWGCCTDSRNYHSVQAYTFRCKISLWKMLAAYNLPGLCTVWHTQTVCPHLSPAHKRKSKEYNYSVIHRLMSYIAFTMLTDL